MRKILTIFLHGLKNKIYIFLMTCLAVCSCVKEQLEVTYNKQEDQIDQVIESTLVNVGGLICDGAKSTCAAKLATALDAMLLATEMLEEGYHFGENEGLMGKTTEETISNVCFVGKNGMSETDLNVLKIMTGEINTTEK